MVSRQTLAKLALGVSAVAISVLLVELFLRLGPAPPWHVRPDPDHDTLMAPHPNRGYGLRPGIDRVWTRRDWAIRVRFNESGMRDEPVAELRAADLRVLAIGDSFTMGIGVESDETWSSRLESLLAARMSDRVVRVANAGVPGYSTNQIYQSLEDLYPDLEPHIVILAHYASSHWRNDNPYRLYGSHLVLRDSLEWLDLTEDGVLLYSDLPEGKAREVDLWLKRHFYVGARAFSAAMRVLGAFGADPPLDEEAESLEEAHAGVARGIARAREFTESRGARLIVLLVNRQQFDGRFATLEPEYNRIVSEIAEREKTMVVDPLPEMIERADGQLLYAYPSEIHWTPLAHQIAAEALFEAITETPAPDRELR